MLPWQLFANAFAGSGGSLVGNANLISKVYFPRLVIPASAVIVGFVDFLISSLILIGLMAWYHYLPDWRIIVLPAYILLTLMIALGSGLWIAALNVRYRDFQHIVPFIVQFGLYISPVGFSSNVVPERWRVLYAANPLVGVIDGFRWTLMHGAVPIDWQTLQLSFWVTLLILFSGIRYFRKTERTFADMI